MKQYLNTQFNKVLNHKDADLFFAITCFTFYLVLEYFFPEAH